MFCTRWLGCVGLSCLFLFLAGCAHTPKPAPQTNTPARLADLMPADVILLGEQHDAPDHHRLQAEAVSLLTSQGQLAALVLEMAEQGRHTRALNGQASEAQVREALAWSNTAWPWDAYSASIMAAVRAGAPVLGANLPRSRLSERMKDPQLERLLPDAALKTQQERIRQGHCGSLPESRIAPMVRVQIARDMAMAHTLQTAARSGQTVVLLAGRGHVDRAVGVPLHLPSTLRTKAVGLGLETNEETSGRMLLDAAWPAQPGPAIDYCAQFKAIKAPGNKP